MRILPRGITGFRDRTDPPLPVIDVRAFRAACHAAARALGGQVGPMELPHAHPTANYGQALLILPGGPIRVLIHNHLSLLAFSQPGNAESKLPLIDHLELAAYFQTAGYQTLTALEAKTPTTKEACQFLSDRELREVAYWRPATLGEIIFNCWD